MAADTKIEWATKTWNPTVGCAKVSPGRAQRYASKDAWRMRTNPRTPAYRDLRVLQGGRSNWSGEVRCLPERLEQPRRWPRPERVFVNSVSDLFHEDVPLDFIRQVFAVIRECPHHRFMILTKRGEHLAELARTLEWHPNVWMGVRWRTPITLLASITCGVCRCVLPLP